jgi:hypothetical protein
VQIPKITTVEGQITDQIRQQIERSYIGHLSVFYGRNNSFLSNNKFPKPIMDTNIKHLRYYPPHKAHSPPENCPPKSACALISEVSLTNWCLSAIFNSRIYHTIDI